MVRWREACAIGFVLGTTVVLATAGCSSSQQTHETPNSDGDAGGPEASSIDSGSPDAGEAEAGDSAGAQVEADVGAPNVCDESCELTCEAGLNRCGDRCVDLMHDPTHCGDCAKDCGAGMLCDMGNCKRDCGDLSLCDDVCLDLRTDVDHCGACDVACPRPTGDGTAVCRTKSCGVVCKDGEPVCGTACCAPPPPNKTMVCQDGKTCVARCLGFSAVCGDGQTTCASWDFESGTIEGVIVPAVGSAWDGVKLLSSLTQQLHGARSLAIGVDTTNSSLLDVNLHLCDDPNKPFDGNTALGIHTSIRIEAAPTFSSFSVGEVGVYYSFYNRFYNGDAPYHHPGPDAWVSIDDVFFGNVYPIEITDIVMHVSLPGPGWKGTVYLDDIRIY